MRELRVGIIGLGVGAQHIAGYQRHPACRVTTLCDLAEDKLATAAEEYPAMTVTKNADDVLLNPDIDVVSVASYDNCHYAQIVEAVEHGKHVFAEKPLCLTAAESRGLRRLFRNHPEIVLSSNLILRQCPRFLRLKELVAQGTFGELFSVEGDYLYGRLHKVTDGWRGQVELYSVVLGGAIHLIDLLLWLTGDRVVEVHAVGNRIASRNSQFRYNDFVAALLTFRSGLIGKVTANFGCVHPHFHGLALYGTKATFLNGPEEGTLFVDEHGAWARHAMTDPYPGYHKGDLIYSFVESILHGTPAAVTADEVFATMSVALAIEQATRQRGPVMVDYP
jgi:predicted dehydrogenase